MNTTIARRQAEDFIAKFFTGPQKPRFEHWDRWEVCDFSNTLMVSLMRSPRGRGAKLTITLWGVWPDKLRTVRRCVASVHRAWATDFAEATPEQTCMRAMLLWLDQTIVELETGAREIGQAPIWIDQATEELEAAK